MEEELTIPVLYDDVDPDNVSPFGRTFVIMVPFDPKYFALRQKGKRNRGNLILTQEGHNYVESEVIKQKNQPIK